MVSECGRIGSGDRTTICDSWAATDAGEVCPDAVAARLLWGLGATVVRVSKGRPIPADGSLTAFRPSTMKHSSWVVTATSDAKPLHCRDARGAWFLS